MKSVNVFVLWSSLPSSYQRAAELAAAADVRDREHDAAVEQAHPRRSRTSGSIDTSYEP